MGGLVAVGICVALAPVVARAAYTLPADRVVTWRGNVGVAGDIPARAAVCRSLSPSGADDASAIRDAIAACATGQVVQLGSGTFQVGSAITLKSGVTLRGAGMGVTIIRGLPGMSGSYVIGANAGAFLGASVALTGGLTKGSTTITTAASHGWTAGALVLIDQLNDGAAEPVVSSSGNNGTCTWCGRQSGTRSLGQVAKVVAVPSLTTATLEIPLYWSYDASRSPQATKLAGVTTDAGVESLTIDNLTSASASQLDNGIVALRYASNCWLFQVELLGSYQHAVYLNGTYRNTVRGCKLHEGTPPTPVDGSQYSPDHAYGIALLGKNSAGLFENNQLYHLRLPLSMSGVASGNVFAYNYITLEYSESSAGDFQLAAFTTHGAHPMMNLLEGNFADGGRLRADNVWGSSSHNTFFRNRSALDTSRPNGAYVCDLHAQQQGYNVVGNVLGSSGFATTYEYDGGDISSQRSIFRLGYSSDGDTSASGNDARVGATLLRHENYDTLHGSTVLNDNGDAALDSADATLPASLYLAAKPAWMGTTVPWPPIGPDVSPMYPSPPSLGTGTPFDRVAPAQQLRSPENLTVH